MRIVPRAEWGAAPARSQTVLQPSRVVAFVLHHTTGRYAGPQTVRQIQQFHQGPERGWADIGYNFLIAPDGTIFEGRGWGLAGAHARNHNSTTIGAAFIGDGRQPVPDAALQSILWLAGEADRRFGKLNRQGHRDVGSTVCPGDVLYQWWMAAPREVAPKAPSAPEAFSKGSVAEKGQVLSQSISEPCSPVPDLRDGWLRHMVRQGWLRRG
jgi:hypothetical protein